MTEDIETLRMWLRAAVLVTAICTTSVPLVYSFSPWRSRPIGRVIMLQAVALAGAVDLSALFSFWATRNILVIFWVNIFVLTAISLSAGSLAWMIWRLNHIPKRRFTMILSGPLYDFMKKVVQVILPGLSSLYFGLAQLWNLGYVEQVLGTTALIATFLGLILGLSSKTYNAQPATYDGSFTLEDHPDGEGMKQLRLVQADLKALETKEVITFKLVPPRIQ